MNNKSKKLIKILKQIKKEKNTIAELKVKKYALESKVYSLPSINPAIPIQINAVSDHDALMVEKAGMISEIERIEEEIKIREKLIDESMCIFNSADIKYKVMLIDVYLFDTTIQKEAEKYNLDNRKLSGCLYQEIENIIDKSSEWKRIVETIKSLNDETYLRIINA